jgi:hypothetical protein
MSAMVHCDGPGCDMTRDPGYNERTISDAGWLHVEQDPQSLDFCSHECVGKWALAQPGNTTTVVDGS